MAPAMKEQPDTLESELTPEESDALKRLLRNAKYTGPHLEIGTAAGGTLADMMRCYEDRARPHFVAIDTMTYFRNQHETIRKNLSNRGLNPDDVEFRIARSHDAFARAEQAGERYDFIFIDGAHKCKYVMQDLCWARLLRKGGLLCLHDYAPATRGVMLASDRFVKKYRNYTKVALAGKLLILRKDADSISPEVSLSDHGYATLMTSFVQLRNSIEKRARRFT
jgi:predicted O-methyltransferase YrrM